ncbi:hypothetical protein F5Y12DRAFT_437877 [Xylaria sp. FL1777]|nr:hypothetical protein F5Y12DRAFT_437877 [Xylaria sp. FL1777]
MMLLSFLLGLKFIALVNLTGPQPTTLMKISRAIGTIQRDHYLHPDHLFFLPSGPFKLEHGNILSSLFLPLLGKGQTHRLTDREAGKAYT